MMCQKQDSFSRVIFVPQRRSRLHLLYGPLSCLPGSAGSPRAPLQRFLSSESTVSCSRLHRPHLYRATGSLRAGRAQPWSPVPCLWSQWSPLILTLLPSRVSALSWFLSRRPWSDEWTRTAQPVTMSRPRRLCQHSLRSPAFCLFDVQMQSCLSRFYFNVFWTQKWCWFLFFVFCATCHNSRWKKKLIPTFHYISSMWSWFNTCTVEISFLVHCCRYPNRLTRYLPSPSVFVTEKRVFHICC